MAGCKKIKDEIWDNILDHISNSGLKPLCAVRLEGVSHTTYYKKIDQDVSYNESIKKAVEAFKQYHLNNIKKHAAKDWKASAWLLERTFKDEYSLKEDDKKDTQYETVDFKYTVSK